MVIFGVLVVGGIVTGIVLAVRKTEPETEAQKAKAPVELQRLVERAVGGGIEADLKFLPSDLQLVASIRADQGINSDVWKELKREFAETAEFESTLSRGAWMSLSDVERVTAGGLVSANNSVVVFTLKRNVEANDVRSSMGGVFVQRQVGSYTMYENNLDSGQSFAIVGSHTVVFARASELEPILERNRRADFSAAMQKTIDVADWSKTIAFAVTVKALDGPTRRNLAQKIPRSADLDVGDVDGVAGHVHFGSDTTATLTALCPDAASARRVQKVVDGWLIECKREAKNASGSFSRHALDVLEKVKVTQNGNTSALSITIKTSQLVALVDGAKRL
jgi:hypothetical protein